MKKKSIISFKALINLFFRNQKQVCQKSTLFLFGLFALTLTSCTKERVGPTNQNLLSTDQTVLQATSNNQTTATFNFTSSEKIEIDIPVFIPCANGGAGEDVVLSGYLHVLTSFTINDNIVRGKFLFQPQGISGVGLTTGDTYHATGGTQGEFKGSFVNGQYEETSVNNFRIIGQGTGNNLLVHENFHITVNANGVVTTVIDNTTIDCK